MGRIEDKAHKACISDVEDYIKEGKWKLRAGGRDMEFPSALIVKSIKPNLVLEIKHPQKLFLLG